MLDTKGIRQAVGPPLDLTKAGNSLALKDLFDGVDEPLIVITATISVEIAASAAIIKISAKGGITFVVTIDLYDPFPDTSEGLIRPFELLSLGSSPLDWFEIKLSIVLELSISIEIGIFLGFFEITLFEVGYGFTLAILPGKIFAPKPIQNLVELNEITKELRLFSDRVKSNSLECFSRSGDVGNEEIECVSGDLYRTYSGVKNVCARESCNEYVDATPSTAVAILGVKNEVSFD